MRFPNGTALYHHVSVHQAKKNLPFLMMLHGFMGSEDSFKHLIPSLNLFCNPVTIDLTGHGKSSKSDDPNHYLAEMQVSDLLSVMNRLGRDNWNLYGYSMGGRLAYQLISHKPDLFQSTFIESAHCGLQDAGEIASRKQNDEELASKIETDFSAFVDGWLKNPLFTRNDSNVSAEYEKQMHTQDPSSMAASLRGFGAGTMPSVCDSMRRIKSTVHLISGENDHKYVKISEKIAGQNSFFTHHIIPGANHRVHLDQPDKLISLLEKYLTLR